MTEILLQMAALIACGSLWRHFRPLGLDADASRRVLTGLVYVILLPALVLSVLWRAPLGLDAVRTAVAAGGAVVAALLLTWATYRLTSATPAQRGALILAAAFPNATYLGLPVLQSLFGPWGGGVAIQYDLFACTPLLLTAGMMVACRHGGCPPEENPLRTLMKVPPLWAALIAVALNLTGTPMPGMLKGLLEMLAGGVVPLMLIALGMSLQWESLRLRRLPLLLPAMAIRLAIIPLLVWLASPGLGLEGQRLTAVVLEAAMPSMVLGIVLCDRYRLDTPLYAMTVALTTALSLVTLPFWFEFAGG